MEAGATKSYGKFVVAIEAANKSLLPKKTRQKQIDPSSDLRVDRARRGLFLIPSGALRGEERECRY